jgi:hypothetical protein
MTKIGYWCLFIVFEELSNKDGAKESPSSWFLFRLAGVLKFKAFVWKKVSWTSIAADDAGTLSEAFVAIKNFSFHSCRDKESALHSTKTSLSMTVVVIEGVTKAVVVDLATYNSPGTTSFLDA